MEREDYRNTSISNTSRNIVLWELDFAKSISISCTFFPNSTDNIFNDLYSNFNDLYSNFLLTKLPYAFILGVLGYDAQTHLVLQTAQRRK